MLAVVKPAAGPGLKVVEVDVPTIGPGEVLLKVRAASICGTDLHIVDWDSWAASNVRPPVVIGHEFHGEVVEAGRDVKRVRVGDLVSVESHVPCGSCWPCGHDMMHICENLKIFGVQRDGGFAQFVAVPEICAWRNSPGLPAEVATLMEPMGNSVHVVSEAQVEGRSIAVFGCGPAGLFATAVAKAKGAARIAAVDVNRGRLELARSMGADELFDGADADVAAKLWTWAGGHGLDATLEMSGSASGVRNALRSLRNGGTMVAFGLPTRPFELDLANDVIMKGRRVIGVLGRRMFRDWEEMQRLLDGGKLDPRPAVTHRFKLAEIDQALATIRSGDRVGKVVLMP